jgi:hypothetical protein
MEAGYALFYWIRWQDGLHRTSLTTQNSRETHGPLDCHWFRGREDQDQHEWVTSN